MKPVLGFALTGSFCTLEKTFAALSLLQEEYDIIPIVSECVAHTDTRFYPKETVLSTLGSICRTPPLQSIAQVEPLGPQNKTDLLVVCPCTGNTLTKLSLGITDTTVTMAVKSHRRAGKPVLIALSTNDALSGSAVSIARLLEKKGFYFVPFRQDAPAEKPFSLQSDFSLLPAAIRAALEDRQLQPVLR